MDVLTLAMAKAYTDEKVAAGGSGGGLPVVEIANAAAITEEESAALSQAAAAGMAVIIKCMMPDNDPPLSLCLVCHYGNGSFGTSFGGADFTFYPTDQGWFLSVK